MTRREINAAIRLTGIAGDYQVHHDMPGEAIVCHVSQASVGHAIVRALRERAGAVTPSTGAQDMLALLKAVAGCPQAAPWLARLPFGDTDAYSAVTAHIARMGG